MGDICRSIEETSADDVEVRRMFVIIALDILGVLCAHLVVTVGRPARYVGGVRTWATLFRRPHALLNAEKRRVNHYDMVRARS
jgi:hypothetical protein